MAIVIIVTAAATIAVPALFGKYTSDATDSYMQAMSAYNVKLRIFCRIRGDKKLQCRKIIKSVHDRTLASMEQKKYKYRSVMICFLFCDTYYIFDYYNPVYHCSISYN